MTVLIVDGMACEGCVKAVTRAIKAASPDAHVEVDLASRAVTVDSTLDKASLIEAVQGAGYEVRSSV